MDNIVNITASGQPPEPPKPRSDIEQLEYLTALLNDLSFGDEVSITRGGSATPPPPPPPKAPPKPKFPRPYRDRQDTVCSDHS